MKHAADWYVYMVLCTDNSLYTGITVDIERRIDQHATKRGAKYFYGREPQHVKYLESKHTRSSASRREALIKRMRRPEKNRLIASASNEAPKYFS